MGKLGLFLVLVSWFLAWSKISPLSEHAFFPLWLGYVLSLNALANLLLGHSLLTRLKAGFLWLFLISVPLWWLFEFFNSFTQNWHYLLGRPVSPFEYFWRASLDFSTVVPAVLSTAYLFTGLLTKIQPKTNGGFQMNLLSLLVFFLFGFLGYLAIIFFPTIGFPLVWVVLFIFFETINYLFGFPSLLERLSRGEWQLPLALALGTLFTGFWWELWNFYSLPKWFYTVPHVGYFKVFEMPILGFLGYPFFGLEIYSMTIFVFGLLARYFKDTGDFID